MPARGRYFEDFAPGDRFVTPARTITNTDIVNFACLTGDFNPPHADFEYAKSTPIGEIIAHGPLVYGVAAGLQYASGINDGTVLALLQVDKWRILKPTIHGDTIRLEQEVLETKETSKADRGVVKFRREVLNQHNEIVMEMEATIMYRRKPA